MFDRLNIQPVNEMKCNFKLVRRLSIQGLIPECIKSSATAFHGWPASVLPEPRVEKRRENKLYSGEEAGGYFSRSIDLYGGRIGILIARIIRFETVHAAVVW
jgi:hypothetical protein